MGRRAIRRGSGLLTGPVTGCKQQPHNERQAAKMATLPEYNAPTAP
jgi:hypothetical protein